MEKNESPNPDPELSDESLNELLGIEAVHIKSEFWKKAALRSIDLLTKEGYINARTTLDELTAIMEKYITEIRELSMTDSQKKEEYIKLLNDLYEAKGALQALRNEGTDPELDIKSIKDKLAMELKKAEERVDRNEIERTGK